METLLPIISVVVFIVVAFLIGKSDSPSNLDITDRDDHKDK